MEPNSESHMKCTIIGEDEEDIGAKVTDNNGTKHQIEMHKKSGEIYAHNQDGYPDDPSDRTLEENEHVAQAQRFAKYYVYRQRSYDTLPPLPNPDRISAVAAFIDSLSEETFETYFGDLYQQMQHHAGRADPVVAVPDAAENQPTYYRKDVYLDVAHEDLQDATPDPTQGLFDTLQETLKAATDSTGLYDRLETVQAETPDGEPTDEPAVAEQFIEAVSGVHIMWSPASNQTETIETDAPEIDRNPDARIELPPYEPDSLTAFQDHVVAHLRCQIRDCYLTMGIAPPPSVRIQGPGWFDRATWFQHYDVYEPYHRDDVEITDWQQQQTPAEMLSN